MNIIQDNNSFPTVRVNIDFEEAKPYSNKIQMTLRPHQKLMFAGAEPHEVRIQRYSKAKPLEYKVEKVLTLMKDFADSIDTKYHTLFDLIDLGNYLINLGYDITYILDDNAMKEGELYIKIGKVKYLRYKTLLQEI